ncbi:MAG: hypothetical protein GY714_12805 [Desulfobacterales bacterium]|nr:hypothetical protein [Desulfobacterales bacterium]MCP4162325.1 hypothetical protein [Deltaproteobacteria bacterium]
MSSEITVEEKLLANAIHGLSCKEPHTKGMHNACEFFDDLTWDEPGPIKMQYLDRARTMLQKYSYDQIKQIVSMINGKKPKS